jgi:NADH:ubiquinone oxidoreductase subunit 6 (subunit J)
MWFLIIYAIAVWIANIFLCAWLADEKNRKAMNWTFLSIFFGFLATFVLMAAPMREKKELPHN